MKYKKRTQGRTSVVSVHIYIDEDLMPSYIRLQNKTRFINDAIREKIERDGQVLND